MAVNKIDKIKEREAKAVVDRNLRIRSKSEIDYTLDGSVKQLFLNLTRMQIPFNYEQTVAHLFPRGMKIDDHGNYYIKIGNSKTMFCGHLDTYSYEFKKVFHVIEGNIIKTDGTTTLGGDDKAGITIMIKMIEAKVPGLYYFFRGEEGVTSPTGTWGSKQALKSYENLFKNYDKCIAFDRRGNNSIITQQMYSICCSDEFSKKLIDELNENGLKYEDDPTGMWCDSGVFMELIPECTNISVGYKDEHTFHETQDIEHLSKLVNACINIDWENLPVKRDPNEIPSYGVGRYKYNKNNSWDRDYDDDYYNSRWNYSNYGDRDYNEIKPSYDIKKYKTMKELFLYVCDILGDVNYDCINPKDFMEMEEMYFQNYRSQDFFGLKIVDYDIYISEDETLKSYEFIGGIDAFESYVRVGYNTYGQEEIKNTKDSDILAYFTKDQEKTYREFVTNRPDILSEIIDDVLNSKVKTLSSQMWLIVDKAMTNYGIKLIYDQEDGINADDLVDWIYYNWEECEKIKKEWENTLEKRNKKNVDVSSFKNNKDYRNPQIMIFSDIAINKIPVIVLNFIKQVIDKGIINNDNDIEKYKTSVDSWIDDNGYKNEHKKYPTIINNKTFLQWIIDNKEDLKNVLQ